MKKEGFNPRFPKMDIVRYKDIRLISLDAVTIFKLGREGWMNDQRLLVGWKEIMAAFGVRSLKTMKKKVKKYAIPVVTVARRPTIYLQEVEAWREARKGRHQELV